ncbi:MAG TPA: bifunctional methionine sulfoxide reductase B/A protein [Bacteroidales bacterium]|nr:bifunctional methionine sulfoxide reductase B/A protein [Bacteroidales bacterium]
MKKEFVIILLMSMSLNGCTQNKGTMNKDVRTRSLTPQEAKVILDKGTERPFTGQYNNFYEKGAYACKNCGALLYRSEDKFKSDCGWPSFDDEIKGAVKRTPDPDGMRTEITCTHCGAHLGHVFTGEGFTDKDVRHCVNSVSLQFIPAGPDKNAKTDTAIFAGGCFWGVEYYMHELPGVLSTEVGYIGGNKDNPSYKEVSSHKTGHAEAIRVVFDPSKTTYEKVAKMFFEIHDPTQLNRQGPDVGDQYRSEVFYLNMEQKSTTDSLIDVLKSKGLDVVTAVTPVSTFWKAEDYHQQYYSKENGTPYCHKYVHRF